MFSGVRMRFIIVMIFLYIAATTDGKSTKKSKDELVILNKKLIGKLKPSPPAIIAIEIVDPNENKTSKNSKRTVDSSLGYGYQSPPKYQVYKYSQHDIPPYRGSPNFYSRGIKTHHYDIQKSVSYRIPSQNHKSQSLNQYYQPGTTLYSTLNGQGQVGSLSSHLPQQPYSNEPHVPVIILRVYPSQLNDPSAALHANLPQTHPLASTINSIDIQSLLMKYVQNVLIEQQQQQQQQYQYQPDYQYQYVQQPQYNDYPDNHPDDELLTHENYPRETHTRVIFRTDKNKIRGSQPHTQTKTIQVAIPAHTYSAVQVETPVMQYGYTSQDDGASQGYYYQQSGEPAQSYYYQSAPEPGYQQVEQQYAQPEPNVQNNHHTHQKRSKKARFARIRLQAETPNDVIKLEPIKA